MSNGDGRWQLSRRQLLKAGALTAGGALLGDLGYLLAGTGQHAGAAETAEPYPFDHPENVLFTTCLQCNTQCTLKTKIQDGILAKIDGNPYSPMNLLPALDYGTDPATAARVDGSICSKGQAGVQTLYDPYRLRKVLKRAGPRGSNRWQTIDFDQAVREIVEGGKLFAHLGEDRVVPGFKDVFVLRDPALSKAMADDVAAIRAGRLTVDEFKAKYAAYLDLLIDPDHPDLGPKNNQFVLLGGRISPDREKITQRFTYGSLGSVNWYGHTTICEQAHHIAFQYATAQWNPPAGWQVGTNHMKPDYANAEFVIFWGTGFAEANFGPPPMSTRVSRALVEGRLKVAVIDPRLSKSAAKGWWIPIRPGGDLALALALIRWIVENGRYDESFLRNANKAAARAAGEPSWTNATWLVNPATGRFVRAADLGLGSDSQFVAMVAGQPVAVDPYDEATSVVGDLDVDATLGGLEVKSAFRILREAVTQRSLDAYAQDSGVDLDTIVALAKEFTAHGKRAAIDFYRGPIMQAYGYYAGQAIIILNFLIGNVDHVGGLAPGGGSWDAMGGKPGQPYPLDKMHPGALTKFGIKLTREASGSYESSTLFGGYPAPRPWFPFTFDVYQEVIPSAYAGYPYPIKILWLHYGTPALATPAGHLQIAMLRDTERIPLFIATDVTIGETSQYADYIFPDLSYLERWSNGLGTSPVVLTKNTKFRQPVAAPVTEIVRVDGEEMPLSADTLVIALAKALGASGFGADGLGSGLPLHRTEDYHLKMVANVAWGDKDGDAVPEASDAELELFRRARRHLPAAVFDEARWQAAVGEHWRRVVTVLNRGGRFEASDRAYQGELVAHPWGKLLNLYVEPIGSAVNAMTGQRFSGVPVPQELQGIDGRPVTFPAGADLELFTYKEIWGGQSRTAGNYAGQLALMPENFVYLNSVDARRLGLADGDVVRLTSTGFDGTFELAPGERRAVEGRVKVIEGLRPGSVMVSWHYGHWAYGAQDIEIDGVRVAGDPARGKGLVPNPAMAVDPALRDVTLTDPISGQAAFTGTRVRLVKVAEGSRVGLPGSGAMVPLPVVAGPPGLAPAEARQLQERALAAARGEADPRALAREVRRRLGLPD
jgi:anaerobic selenocysteine-containing dehydrogenase